jgi:hypothetical protein
MRKRKDPDPGGLKTCGSRSPTLPVRTVPLIHNRKKISNTARKNCSLNTPYIIEKRYQFFKPDDWESGLQILNIFWSWWTKNRIEQDQNQITHTDGVLLITIYRYVTLLLILICLELNYNYEWKKNNNLTEDMQMPMWPMKGKSQLMQGMGVHTIQ